MTQGKKHFLHLPAMFSFLHSDIRSGCTKVPQCFLTRKEEIMTRKSSLQGKILKDLIAMFADDFLTEKRTKNGTLRLALAKLEPDWVPPPHYSVIMVRGRNCDMELLQYEKKNHSRIVLQLHGGGYIGGFKNVYRNFAVMYSAKGGGISVLSVDYRLAPRWPFPAALEDALSGYEWLLAGGWKPQQIVVAGDSAGGGLALALCHYLKDNDRPLPGGVIVMSPWTDMTASGSSYAENYHKDPLFGNAEESMLTNTDYRGNNDPKNPYLSPLFGDFHGFPTMLIQVGGDEMLLSDSVLVAKKAKKQGVRLRLSVYDGMFHVFQMALQLLPESRRAWNEIGHFLRILE